jgi:two-component system, OmpR family, response regulator RegX3
MRVLIVEDDPSVAEKLAEGLGRQGFETTSTDRGFEALTLAAEADVVLLDLALPDLDGLEVCRRLRERSQVPIIAMSAQPDEAGCVLGLELGADDYVGTPSSTRELGARIRAHARRVAADSGPPPARGGVSRLGSLLVDRRGRHVTVDGRTVALTAKEFDLLETLMADPGAVVRRGDLMARVWDVNWFGSTKTLDVHIASLRHKLGDRRLIETVRGVGYRMADPEGPARPVGAPPAATGAAAQSAGGRQPGSQRAR